MRRARELAAAVLLATAAIAAGGAERPLARVDGEAITGADLERDFGSRHGGHTAFLVGEDELRRALDGFIDRVLLRHEAERLELDTRPEVREAGADLARRLALEHLLETEISRPAAPAEEEIRAAWERYAGFLVSVRQIVVAERDAAAAAAGRLAAGEPFAELAASISEADSRRNGGLLPPIRWGTMGSDWDEAVFGLAPGEVSAPFWNGAGWELVQLVERLPVERPEYARARELIRGALLRANLARRQRQLSERLWRQYGVELPLAPYDPAGWAALDDDSTAVATWRGGSLTLAELAETVDLAALAALPGERGARELESEVRTAVNQELAAAEAVARGYLAEPEVEAAVASYRDEAMEAILHGEFVFREVTVTEAEVRAWYEANAAELAAPERRRVAQILLDTEAGARAARRRLEAGEPFAELARELSLDRTSAARGGGLGWIGARELPPGFEPVFALPAGAVSEPLETELGWHLIAVEEIEPEQARSFGEAADEVRRKLLREKRRAARDRWLEALRAAAEIEIAERAVRDLAARLAAGRAGGAEPPPAVTPHG